MRTILMYFVIIFLFVFVISQPLSEIHFAIIIGIAYRSNDPNFYLLNRTLESIKKQTFQNYTVVLVGDVLSSTSEAVVLSYLNKMSNETWIYQNLEYEKSEIFTYQQRNPLPCHQNKEQINSTWKSGSKVGRNYWFVVLY